MNKITVKNYNSLIFDYNVSEIWKYKFNWKGNVAKGMLELDNMEVPMKRALEQVLRKNLVQSVQKKNFMQSIQ